MAAGPYKIEPRTLDRDSVNQLNKIFDKIAKDINSASGPAAAPAAAAAPSGPAAPAGAVNFTQAPSVASAEAVSTNADVNPVSAQVAPQPGGVQPTPAVQFFVPITAFGATGPGTAFGVSQVLAYLPIAYAVTFASAFSGSVANLRIAATASTVFTILQNGSSIGTITFAASGSSGTFAGSGTFNAGDILEIQAPATPDVTAADLGVMLVGTRPGPA